MTLSEMLHLYETLSAVHLYLIGFNYNGDLYYAMVSFAELASVTRFTRASSAKGGMHKVRIRTNKTFRENLVASGRAVRLGTIDMMDFPGMKNKGDCFEKVIVEHFTNRVWKHDSTPFYKAGDVVINGEQVQVKFDEAELTNERVLSKALAQMVA